MSNTAQYETHQYQFIDTAADLESFCSALSGGDFIAIDTEFLREKTYYPELCLVQIKQGDHLACIDTLAIKDLSALIALMNNQSITKVFRAAAQDMEIFVMLDKQAPAPIFDTQVAAPLLGYQEQIGYGNLVKDVLGITLAKTHTRADWSRRPIPDKQLHYALDDVIHLEELYLTLREQLTARGRLEWLAEEFKDMSTMERYNKPAKLQWQKLRAAQQMKGQQLATLQALAEWRELYARESNKPKSWVLKDDALSDLAKQRPNSLKELSHVRSVNSRVQEKLGEKLLAVIADAADRKPEPLPAYIKTAKPTAMQVATTDALTAVVSAVALQHDVNPTQLATRKQLQNMVIDGNSDAVVGWQKAILGSTIDEFLSGKISISTSNNEIVLTRH